MYWYCIVDYFVSCVEVFVVKDEVVWEGLDVGYFVYIKLVVEVFFIGYKVFGIFVYGFYFRCLRV